MILHKFFEALKKAINFCYHKVALYLAIIEIARIICLGNLISQKNGLKIHHDSKNWYK